MTQYEGWRLAFAILGFVSLAIGLANFVFSKDPRSFDGHPPSTIQHGKQNGMRMFMAALKDVKSVVTVPTFAIIIVQVRNCIRLCIKRFFCQTHSTPRLHCIDEAAFSKTYIVLS